MEEKHLMYPHNTINKFPAFIKRVNVFMQYSYPTEDSQAVYAYFDSTTQKVQYLEISLGEALSSRQYLHLCPENLIEEADVVFAKNKTKILTGLTSLTKSTQFKQGTDVTALLQYGENDQLNYLFKLKDNPPSLQTLELVQTLSSRPTNFNEVILSALKEEQSYGWSLNQAMLSTGVFTYVEDLVAYQGNREYKSWMFHFHVAA